MESTLIVVIGNCFVLVGVLTGGFFVIESSRQPRALGGLLL